MLSCRRQGNREDDDMTALDRLQLYTIECPMIAILRGIRPHESVEVGTALFDAGIRIIEVPLNSPDPLESIRRLSAHFGDRALVGAGTVLQRHEVADVRTAGGRIIVSPGTEEDVIAATASEGLISCPGYFTPSEAFRALRAGATALKLFPAEAASPSVLRAQCAVLPSNVPIFVVGGISPSNMQPWLDAGALGFGLGSGLYRAGQSAEDTARKASEYIAGLRR